MIDYDFFYLLPQAIKNRVLWPKLMEKDSMLENEEFYKSLPFSTKLLM